MSDYIPGPDADFSNWSANFATVVGGDPTTYGLDAAAGTTITDQDTTWQAAYSKAIDPASRTPVAVADKDAERATAEATYRGFANQIQANPGITNEQLVAAGLTVRKTTPSPPITPTSAPALDLRRAKTGFLEVKWQNPETPDSRARPDGSVGVLFEIECYDKVADDYRDAPGSPIVTGRNPAKLKVDPYFPDNLYRVRARFLGGRDEDGNISNGPVSPWKEFSFAE